ncbi:MAG: RNA polymerase sigma factor [Bacteroidota bacterium]
MNRKQYNHAVKTYSGQIYRYARKFLRDDVVADDIVQDVFLKLWDHRKRVDATKVRAWLFRTAHNHLINHAKRESRQEPMDTARHDPGHTAGHRYELQDLLEKYLALLPPIQKSILLLRDLEGYNYKEIGEMLNLSDSQVKVYLYRARQRMKEQLKGILELR